MAVRALSRAEGKAVTRQRLLDAASALLEAGSYSSVTASAIARAAGVAQPTFYVHFRDTDELFRAYADSVANQLLPALRSARGKMVATRGLEELRESYRIPLRIWTARPGFLAVWTREIRDPSSPIGENLRHIREEISRDLVEDLLRYGLPARTEAERQELELIAEAVVAQTEALGVAYVEGRYTDLEQIIDVLARIGAGVLGIPWTPAKPTRASAIA